MNNHSFEITIPVLNEEAGLKRDVATLYDFCLRAFNGSEKWTIVIADNGSHDNTQSIAEGIASEFGNIKYIRLDRRGVGLALRQSWQLSKADVIGSIDLDLSTDLIHLPEAISAISEKGFDLVYGTRLHKDSNVTGRSLKRELISRAFNLIMRNYLKVSISDGMCGFTFFKRSFLDTLIENGAISEGWFFQAEVLIVSEWLGLIISEIPVHWRDDDQSKVRIFPLVLEYINGMRNLRNNSPISK